MHANSPLVHRLLPFLKLQHHTALLQMQQAFVIIVQPALPVKTNWSENLLGQQKTVF